MSGVELVGIAASILQIADLGWKLSYKLYAFSRKVHEAGKTIELISQDISATGAVLKQFADELDKDEKASAGGRLASRELIKAARGIVEECKTLFKEIDASIDGKDGNKVILGFKAKLKWSYLEPRIQLLSLNLGRLKASLALMLNVLVYAEQIRGREAVGVLLEQKTLIASFAAQKDDTAKKVEQLSKRIEQAPQSVTNPEPIRPAEEPMQQLDDEFFPFAARNNQQLKNSGTSTTRDILADSPQSSFRTKAIKTTAGEDSLMLQASASKSTSSPANSLTLVEEPAASSAKVADLEHQRKLIEKLLEEVNSNNYAIDHGARYKFHDGVLQLHWQVWAPLRTSHGDDLLRQLLSRNPVLARHWHERLSNANSAQMVSEPDVVPRTQWALRPTALRSMHDGEGLVAPLELQGVSSSEFSPRSGTAKERLKARLLKERPKKATIKQEELRAEQDALHEKEKPDLMRNIEARRKVLKDLDALYDQSNSGQKVEEKEADRGFEYLENLRAGQNDLEDESILAQMPRDKETDRRTGSLANSLPQACELDLQPSKARQTGEQQRPSSSMCGLYFTGVDRGQRQGYAKKKEKTSPASIADSLILQWTTVSPPAV